MFRLPANVYVKVATSQTILFSLRVFVWFWIFLVIENKMKRPRGDRSDEFESASLIIIE